MKQKFFMLIAVLILSSGIGYGQCNWSKLFKKIVFYPSLYQDYQPDEKDIKLEFTEVELEGNMLNIEFLYPKGEEQIFDLRYNGMYMKSKPMQLDLFFYANIKNPGDKLVKGEMRFNVERLIPENENELILHLKGYSERIVLKRKS